MAETKPTIILVPGAFHKALHYYKLAMYLTMAGYTVSVVDLPSTTSGEPLDPVYENDVSTISETIRGFTEVGRDVVLVMHGYAGNPGTQAACDFSPKQVAKTGEPTNVQSGAVIKLIYLAAWLPTESQELFSLPWPADFEPYSIPDEKDPRFIRAVDPRSKFYNDISDRIVIDAAIAELEPKAIGHDFVGPDKCAWREIPTVYIVCEEDRTFPSKVTSAMIEAVEAEGVKVQTERLKSGHCPMLSIPKETSRAIVKLIKDKENIASAQSLGWKDMQQ